MLKVITTNATFALVLLLSIPAFAGQPGSAKSVTATSNGVAPVVATVANNVVKDGMKAAAVAKTFSRIYDAIPSWQSIKGKTYAGLSWAGKGFSALGCGAVRGSKAALGYVTPAAKATLAFASEHSTSVKIIAGTLAAAGLGYAGYRTYKHWKTKPVAANLRRDHAPENAPAVPAAVPTASVAPVTIPTAIPTASVAPAAPTAVPTAPAAQGATRTALPVAPAQAADITAPALSDLGLLQNARAAAEADIASFSQIREAGKMYAQLKNQADADQEAVNAAGDDHGLKHAGFVYRMSSSVIPDNQQQLQVEFEATCKRINELLANEDNCLDNHKAEYDLMVGQLNHVIARLDEAIENERAIELSKEPAAPVAQAQQQPAPAPVAATAPATTPAPVVAAPAQQPAATVAPVVAPTTGAPVIAPAAARGSILGAPVRALKGLWNWVRGNNKTAAAPAPQATV